MILRCRAPNRADPTRLCGGLIGAAPDGSVVTDILERFEHAREGAFGMRCPTCRRIFEVLPPQMLPEAA